MDDLHAKEHVDGPGHINQVSCSARYDFFSLNWLVLEDVSAGQTTIFCDVKLRLSGRPLKQAAKHLRLKRLPVVSSRY